MYRYGDGSPFPLDENFIDTLTTAVEACTNAFVPLAELDERRDQAREARSNADAELARMAEFERGLTGAVTPYLSSKTQPPPPTIASAQKIAASAKQLLAQARAAIENKVGQLEAAAQPPTAAAAVIEALRAFFDRFALPNAQWIMSWDVRGLEPRADAVATAGKLTASFQLTPDPWRTPIRVDQIEQGVVVHMMRSGMFGKAKPTPIDLGKYVVVAFERAIAESTITLREKADKAAPGLRFAVANAADAGASWVAITAAGDSEGEPSPLDSEDVVGVRRLTDKAYAALKDLIQRRTLKELSMGGQTIAELAEPRSVPLDLLAQLTPLARTIRERSRMSGELVLKRDIGDGRREELFVPRAQLAQQFAVLPLEYQRPFEEMGLTSEATSPGIDLRQLAKAGPNAPTVQINTDDIDLD
jgi:hypothetical protein